MKYLLVTFPKMVHDPQVENHCTKPTIQYNWIKLMTLRNFFT